MKKKLNFMSASKPMFLDSHLFTLIFLGLMFYELLRLLRGLFTEDIYHGTIMIYDTKTISCTIRAKYYVLENKNTAQLTVIE